MNEIKLNLENLSAAEREQLMALVEKANKPKSKAWKPEYGEYYLICSSGNIGRMLWYGDNSDKGAYELGNVFRTKEEADEELTRRKILTKWKSLSIEAGENENPWDGAGEHWSCYYSFFDDVMHISRSVNAVFQNITFPSKESLTNAINDIGEENVKKYILDVK